MFIFATFNKLFRIININNNLIINIMATRSTITVAKENGERITVYCHWDGYPQNNGKLLLENYNSYEKALSLVELGDLSSLDKSIENPDGHSFNNKIDGYSVFYHRDRRENWNMVKPKITSKSESIFRTLNTYDSEYDYLYDSKSSKWMYRNATVKEKIFIDLTTNVVKEKS